MKFYVVTFGSSTRVYYTRYHADQFARALILNGVTVKVNVPS